MKKSIISIAEGIRVMLAACNKEEPLEISTFGVIISNRGFAGSNIGGISETQQMPDFR